MNIFIYLLLHKSQNKCNDLTLKLLNCIYLYKSKFDNVLKKGYNKGCVKIIV